MRFFTLLSCLCFLPVLAGELPVDIAGAKSTGAGASAAQERAAILASLAGYEWQADSVRLTTTDASSILLDIAGDTALPGVTRARARMLLMRYPDDEVWAYLTSLIGRADAGESQTQPDGTDAVARRRAVEALCETFRDVRPAAVANQLGPILASADPHLRISAARCLGSIDAPGVQDRLVAYRRAVAGSWEQRAVERQSRSRDSGSSP